MQKRFLLLLVVLTLPLTTAAIAAPFWNAQQVANHSADRIRLQEQNGKFYAEVKRSSIRRFIAAKERIESSAGPIRATYFIDAEEKPNAFATYSNGQPMIAINVGMLRLLDEDEEAYAALVGHELAHLYLKHPEKYAERNGLKQVGSALLGFALGYAGVPAGGTIADVATTAISTVYSRDDERDSDELGMKFMLQAGFDPYGAVRMQEKLASAGGISIPFLSSHPSGDERVANMRKLADVVQASRSGSQVAANAEKEAVKTEEEPVVATHAPPPIYPPSPLSSASAPTAVPLASDIPSRLRELKKLYADGIITKGEYEKKRKALVRDL